jgi:hypothetical protein
MVFFLNLPGMMAARAAERARKFHGVEFREEEEKKKEIKKPKEEKKKLLTPKTPTVSLKDKAKLMKEKMKIPDADLRKLAQIAQPLKMTDKTIDINKMLDAHQSQIALDLNKFQQLDLGAATCGLEVLNIGKGMSTDDILKLNAVALPMAALKGAQVGLFTTRGAGVSGSGEKMELETALASDIEEKKTEFKKKVKKVTQKKKMDASSGPSTDIEISGALADRDVLAMPLPPYPEWAQQQGISAYFKVSLKVGPSGKVTGTVVTLSTTGFPQWDNMIVNWIKKNWQWKNVKGLTSPGQIGFNFVIG